ncbi:tetratricopeptide repeat protein [Polaromonas glacialis]|uniref:tetratricopeptide repeat protein n=1 Tax=Polaromonas glacialis TaxID=866564 RepID=UPI0009FE89F8|nr:tetratricopeptide repeat protein [Polaromonas glacialis]
MRPEAGRPPRRSGAALALLLALASPGLWAQDSERGDWLRNPAMGNYKAYAEFKMAHYAAAREVWETLAGIGNGDALFNLGILAEDGLGEPKNMPKAETLYTSAAQAGNFKARYRLGMLYNAGALLPRNVEKARLYLTLAAEGGDKDALATLALLEQPTGSRTRFQQAEWLGASGRHAEAAGLYRELADTGDRQAQSRLAWMHEAGQGVERSLPEAARRFEIAAVAGEAEAQYALAVMLRTGKGREKDLAQSRVWLRRAAAQDHPAAMAALRAESSLDEVAR